MEPKFEPGYKVHVIGEFHRECDHCHELKTKEPVWKHRGEGTVHIRRVIKDRHGNEFTEYDVINVGDGMRLQDDEKFSESDCFETAKEAKAEANRSNEELAKSEWEKSMGIQ